MRKLKYSQKKESIVLILSLPTPTDFATLSETIHSAGFNSIRSNLGLALMVLNRLPGVKIIFPFLNNDVLKSSALATPELPTLKRKFPNSPSARCSQPEVR